MLTKLDFVVRYFQPLLRFLRFILILNTKDESHWHIILNEQTISNKESYLLNEIMDSLILFSI